MTTVRSSARSPGRCQARSRSGAAPDSREPDAGGGSSASSAPGKPNAVMFYMAGHKAYREELSTVARDGYRGFAMHGSGGSR